MSSPGNTPDKEATSAAVGETVTPSPPIEISPSSDPPDGGLLAWLQVAGSFALYWNHLGLLNSFGAFQTYYEDHLLKDSSPSAISWIGSIQDIAKH
ncbi:mfs monocarboxylate transporter [Neofusicoccum parvum]|nr:mfs monocarboxylate transporter [Neofusicoccum parvum]